MPKIVISQSAAADNIRLAAMMKLQVAKLKDALIERSGVPTTCIIRNVSDRTPKFTVSMSFNYGTGSRSKVKIQGNITFKPSDGRITDGRYDGTTTLTVGNVAVKLGRYAAKLGMEHPLTSMTLMKVVKAFCKENGIPTTPVKPTVVTPTAVTSKVTPPELEAAIIQPILDSRSPVSGQLFSDAKAKGFTSQKISSAISSLEKRGLIERTADSLVKAVSKSALRKYLSSLGLPPSSTTSPPKESSSVPDSKAVQSVVLKKLLATTLPVSLRVLENLGKKYGYDSTDIFNALSAYPNIRRKSKAEGEGYFLVNRKKSQEYLDTLTGDATVTPTENAEVKPSGSLVSKLSNTPKGSLRHLILEQMLDKISVLHLGGAHGIGTAAGFPTSEVDAQLKTLANMGVIDSSNQLSFTWTVKLSEAELKQLLVKIRSSSTTPATLNLIKGSITSQVLRKLVDSPTKVNKEELKNGFSLVDRMALGFVTRVLVALGIIKESADSLTVVSSKEDIRNRLAKVEGVKAKADEKLQAILSALGVKELTDLQKEFWSKLYGVSRASAANLLKYLDDAAASATTQGIPYAQALVEMKLPNTKTLTDLNTCIGTPKRYDYIFRRLLSDKVLTPGSILSETFTTPTIWYSFQTEASVSMTGKGYVVKVRPREVAFSFDDVPFVYASTKVIGIVVKPTQVVSDVIGSVIG